MRIGPHWHYQNLFSHAVDKDSSTDCTFQPFYNWGLFLRPAIGGCWINESEGRSFDSWFKSYQFLKRKKRDAPVKFPLFPNACCTSWYLGRVVRLPSPATEGLDASIRKPTRLTSSTVTFSILWNSSWDDFLLLRPKTCLKTKTKVSALRCQMDLTLVPSVWGLVRKGRPKYPHSQSEPLHNLFKALF